MVGRGRAGRNWGPIRAESTEARKLAGFLRAQVDASGKTLAVLSGEIHISKTLISERVGGKVPDQKFVTALIRATVEPQLRDRRLAEARKLLEAAIHPSATTPPPRAASPLELVEFRAQQVEAYDRLTRSLEQQNQLREAAVNSAKLVMVLFSMINRLERRITDLTGERDQLQAAHVDPDTLRRTQQQLNRAREQERRAQQELKRAQEKRCQAEELAATLQAQVDQLADKLDRLRGTTTDDTAAPNIPAGPPTQPAPADPAADDIDQALDRATAVNDQDDRVLLRITHDLVPDASPDEVVPDNSPDNAMDDFLADTIDPDKLTILQAAAQAAAETGNHRKAVRLYTALVDASSRLIDPEHPYTLAAWHELAYWQGEAGDAVGAAAALAELLSVRKRVQGPEHPDTLATRHELARWQGEAGDPAGAARALAELLPFQERLQGPEHPRTLAARHELALWRGEAGDPARAAAALAELLPTQERVQGAQHPRTLATRHELARWQGEAGDPAGAAKAFAELLPLQERVQGPEHPATLTTRHNLALWRGKAGDPAGAAKAFAELLPIRERVQGPEHPRTLATRRNLARWMKAASRPE